MKAVAAGGEDAAEQIARLLREGRAAEVTDEMLGALGPNDQAKLFDLYESGATGMPMSMDEASRMARAREVGFNMTEAAPMASGPIEGGGGPSVAKPPQLFHGASEDFAAFSPDRYGTGAGDWSGKGIYTTPDALEAEGYGEFVMPLHSRAGSVETQYLRDYNWRAPENFAEYLKSQGFDALNMRVRDVDDRTGVVDADWLKERVDFDPANIRSRHARFDPRLSKNADLLASRAPVPGAGGVMATRPTSPAEPSGDGPSLSDVLGRLKQAFGLAGRAGIEGMATALSGVDEQGRSVGSILPFAKDERTGEVGLAAPRILDLWNTAGGVVPAKGITLGAGPILGGRGHITRTGSRSASAYVDGNYAGEVNVAQGGPFISSITVEPGLRGQGIGRELYKEAEELAASQLVPSPLGLSDDAARMWQRRLASMPPDEANALIERSREIGRRYGISDAHLSERLDPLLRAADSALDMSQDARMARARELGFDVDKPVYHGSPDARGIDAGFATATERYDPSIPRRGPYFFTDNRSVAASYADDHRAFDYQNAEPAVIQAVLRKGNALEIDAKRNDFRGIDVDALLDAVPEGAPRDRAAAELDKYSRVRDNKIRTDDLAEIAQEMGYDSVIVKNVRDNYNNTPKTKPSTVYMVFDPTAIRRLEARFDPAKRDSADLLASRAAPGSLGIGGDRRLTYRDVEDWL